MRPEESAPFSRKKTRIYISTLVHEINASLNCAIFGKVAQIKWIRLKCRKVLVRTT